MKKFIPNKGLSLTEIFTQSIEMAKQDKDTIHVIIGETHINVTEKSQVEKLLKYYKFKKDLELKFRTGVIPKERLRNS